jgi:hypothetical protein
MKKEVFLILLVLFPICLQNCHKEEGVIPEPIELSGILENISEYGGNDGSIDLTVSGGTPPYSFLWSNHQHTEDIDSLTTGTYIVIVCDICERIYRWIFVHPGSTN